MALDATRPVRRERRHPVRVRVAAPLPWCVAVPLIGALSGGLWLAIYRLVRLAF